MKTNRAKTSDKIIIMIFWGCTTKNTKKECRIVRKKSCRFNSLHTCRWFFFMAKTHLCAPYFVKIIVKIFENGTNKKLQENIDKIYARTIEGVWWITLPALLECRFVFLFTCRWFFFHFFIDNDICRLPNSSDFVTFIAQTRSLDTLKIKIR